MASWGPYVVMGLIYKENTSAIQYVAQMVDVFQAVIEQIKGNGSMFS